MVPPALALENYSSFHPENRNGAPRPAAAVVPGIPRNGDFILNSPGRVIGGTYYDLQSNGSTGNRIVLDYLGGVHFCWTGSSSPALDQRHLLYGFISETNDSLPAMQLPGRAMSGFAGIDILRGAGDPAVRNRAVVGYHNSYTFDDRFATESSRGSGVFGIDSTGFPQGMDVCFWPQFSVDINDNIQAIATQSNTPDGELHYHIYSRKAYGSSSWTAPLIFDTSYTLSPVITSSPVSAKSAIAWTTPKFQDFNQYDNDVMYLESPNGTSWNVPGGRVNITGYPPTAQGDTTLRAYSDLDAVYDFGDNLHIVWNAAYVTRDTADDMVVLYHSALFHWSPLTGTDLIYDHPVREWPCDMGAWNLSVAKMSIGVDADSNFLYVLFTRFDPADYAYFDTLGGDPSPCGGDNAMPCGNGELYLAWSRDGGNSWTEPVNVTNSPSPDCLAGNCDSDNWSSLAERVDNYLHIVYIDDKDAGSAALQEGDATQSPVIYLKLANPTRSGGGACQYIIGDINNNGAANGIDVGYGVNYFKGGPVPPAACDCPPAAYPFYAAGDVNGNCNFNGIDITFFVNYFKGIVPSLLNCPTCPPTRLAISPDSPDNPRLVPAGGK